MNITLFFKTYFKKIDGQNSVKHDINTHFKLFLVLLLYKVPYSPFLNTAKNKGFTVNVLTLPKKKKNIIFLRAPYKNKLARLNILRMQYTSAVILTTKSSINHKFLINFLIFLQKFQTSTTKNAITKTNLVSYSYNNCNYKLKQYN